MSDTEEEPAPAAVEEEEVEAELSVLDALREVLEKAMIHGGLKKGLHECTKALDRRTARLCCLSKDCENEEYKKLVKGLCSEGEVHVVMVESGKDLGAWCGLAKLDDDGSIKKAVRTSCAVITDFGEETRALSVLLDYLQKQADGAEI
ncbi:ribosomal protein S12 [Fragilariopsis cylindrus CCMP1102]|uniref:40S ribosomal protein S12 n=1 Tax=Fragilariopsis cylindrus CCMP1102 TaxID=635003 RepID=A0A1E7EV64_9STRA|nr:ribosomal protein S12 [Fragilariopsis cylindrus CCMP1102]|eukprot:OEU09871.1 ribosomal protein S12 [Fragilariopsis cylindrus CCMP1102]